MELELTEQEWEYLLELLDGSFRMNESELHHTDESHRRRYLQQRIGLIEGLKSKLLPVGVA
jgi:hypothetical protein